MYSVCNSGWSIASSTRDDTHNDLLRWKLVKKVCFLSHPTTINSLSDVCKVFYSSVLAHTYYSKRNTLLRMSAGWKLPILQIRLQLIAISTVADFTKLTKLEGSENSSRGSNSAYDTSSFAISTVTRKKKKLSYNNFDNFKDKMWLGFFLLISHPFLLSIPFNLAKKSQPPTRQPSKFAMRG